MKHLNSAIIAGLVMLLVGVGVYHYLAGKVLKRVGFQFDYWGLAIDSKYKNKWLWTDDSEFLAKVADWRRNLKRYQLDAALRQGGGRIVLEFKNGRKEEFLTHSLGLTGPGSLVLLNGRHMQSKTDPFSEFLRHIDLKDLK